MAGRSVVVWLLALLGGGASVTAGVAGQIGLSRDSEAAAPFLVTTAYILSEIEKLPPGDSCDAPRYAAIARYFTDPLSWPPRPPEVWVGPVQLGVIGGTISDDVPLVGMGRSSEDRWVTKFWIRVDVPRDSVVVISARNIRTGRPAGFQGYV